MNRNSSGTKRLHLRNTSIRSSRPTDREKLRVARQNRRILRFDFIDAGTSRVNTPCNPVNKLGCGRDLTTLSLCHYNIRSNGSIIGD
jgi:hypothetical protein